MADDGNGNGIPPGRRSLDGDALVGVCRIARALGLGERTVRAAIEKGELPAFRFGVARRVRVVDVRAWISAHRVR